VALGPQISAFGLFAVALAAGLALSGCGRSEPTAPPAPPASPAATPALPANVLPPTKPAAKPVAAGPVEIWKEFSGDRAFEEVRRQVEVGPRPSGTPEIEKARALIEDGLRRTGWEVERQIFTAETPRGPVKFVNLIGRFSANGTSPVPRDTQRAIVCSHYDTKRFSTIRFVGASDGASSTGALIELARVLALDPALAAKVEIVFFDGEEAFVQFTNPDDPNPDKADGLFGSRFYADQLRDSGRARQFKFGILWDMIGDRELTITLAPDSPADLTREILASAEALGLKRHFSRYERSILDDHFHLNRVRIPTIDLIDFDYPAWHTADDTLERLSPESLQKIGAVTLHHLRKALGK
jgi:glutaminyl-peptide cyclotransferase